MARPAPRAQRSAGRGEPKSCWRRPLQQECVTTMTLGPYAARTTRRRGRLASLHPNHVEGRHDNGTQGNRTHTDSLGHPCLGGLGGAGGPGRIRGSASRCRIPEQGRPSSTLRCSGSPSSRRSDGPARPAGASPRVRSDGSGESSPRPDRGLGNRPGARDSCADDRTAARHGESALRGHRGVVDGPPPSPGGQGRLQVEAPEIDPGGRRRARLAGRVARRLPHVHGVRPTSSAKPLHQLRSTGRPPPGRALTTARDRRAPGAHLLVSRQNSCKSPESP